MSEKKKDMLERELLFRGKRYDRRELWAVGDLRVSRYRNVEEYGDFDRCSVCVPDNDHPWVSTIYDVLTETVGQYTGRKDKNGVMIFEGDIVRSSDPDYPKSKMDCGIGKVEFYAGLWYVSGEIQNGLYDLLDICCKDLEVIGNVVDNPKLVEGIEPRAEQEPKMLCQFWNPPGHGYERCEQDKWYPCSCKGDPDRCERAPLEVLRNGR